MDKATINPKENENNDGNVANNAINLSVHTDVRSTQSVVSVDNLVEVMANNMDNMIACIGAEIEVPK